MNLYSIGDAKNVGAARRVSRYSLNLNQLLNYSKQFDDRAIDVMRDMKPSMTI